jgi:hypothetical protein
MHEILDPNDSVWAKEDSTPDALIPIVQNCTILRRLCGFGTKDESFTDKI